MTQTLYAYVRARLEATKGRWPDIAEATGISKRTIEKIASGEIADPGVHKMELLARYFRAGDTDRRAEARV
jgi:transcriptional regulator with XRE-family HTH domain